MVTGPLPAAVFLCWALTESLCQKSRATPVECLTCSPRKQSSWPNGIRSQRLKGSSFSSFVSNTVIHSSQEWISHHWEQNNTASFLQSWRGESVSFTTSMFCYRKSIFFVWEREKMRLSPERLVLKRSHSKVMKGIWDSVGNTRNVYGGPLPVSVWTKNCIVLNGWKEIKKKTTIS